MIGTNPTWLTPPSWGEHHRPSPGDRYCTRCGLKRSAFEDKPRPCFPMQKPTDRTGDPPMLRRWIPRIAPTPWIIFGIELDRRDLTIYLGWRSVAMPSRVLAAYAGLWIALYLCADFLL
jgi:hypothetical protein